jgi:predicted AAA+ superfamily ATPase
VRIYNLLDGDVLLSLSHRPARLREEIPQGSKLVVIDEIQKLPQLLDEVHLLIEERGLRFLLTGSSPRKLRRGGVNLLGGRARTLILHPLVYREVKNFDLLRALNHGLLPSLYLSEQPEEDLRAYAGTYLKEEIAAEGLSRNIPAFSRFLEVAALASGTMINLSRIASDAQVARTTIHEYFRILEDTLIAYTVPAWKRSLKRKPIGTAKFYFFDVGVARQLRNQGWIRERSPAFGEAFETYIFHELKSCVDYRGKGEIAYWRSTSNFEVDFILNGRTAIEVKGKEIISRRDLAGLRALQEEELLREYLVVCLENRARIVEGIQILPWRDFLDRLWDGKYD